MIFDCHGRTARRTYAAIKDNFIFRNFIMRTKFNLFDHTYKLNLRTHKSPINSDNQGSTAVLQISVDLPLYRCICTAHAILTVRPNQHSTCHANCQT